MLEAFGVVDGCGTYALLQFISYLSLCTSLFRRMIMFDLLIYVGRIL